MNTENTGKLIAELRKEKNLTQGQLAEMLNVSDKAVSRWETGRGFPDINILEDISGCLGITVAEIIRGERLSESVSREELQGLSTGWLSLARSVINRKKAMNVIMGFLMGVILLASLMIHLASPIYITDPGEALSLEELPDGRMVAILKEDVAGVDIDRVNAESGSGVELRIACYQTRLHGLTKKNNDTLVLLGEKDEIDAVYYYPTGGDDRLLYSKAETIPNGGTLTLPRLVYNYWILMGLALLVAGIAACFVSRKKYYARTVLELTALPLAFVLSTVLCLAGKFGEVYNAKFYFSGILLLTIAVYLLFIIIIEKCFDRKTSQKYG